MRRFHRTPTVATLVLVLATVAAPGGQADAKRRRLDCLRSGTTIAIDSSVRLFRVGDPFEHTLYTCRIQDRRIENQGEFLFNREGPGLPALVGRYLVADYYVCSRGDGCQGFVGVTDVRRGTGRVAPTGAGRAGSLLVTARGAAAWIRDGAGADPAGGAPPPSPVRSVQVLLPDGTHRLDEGTDIDAGSLARSGSRLYWLKGGVARSATLTDARRAPLVPRDREPGAR